MPAYITVNFTQIDKDNLQKYAAAVPATLEKYSGKFLVKGLIEKLSGNSNYTMQVILEFPNKENATDWYHSPDYQTLIPLRNTGMHSQFQLVST